MNPARRPLRTALTLLPPALAAAHIGPAGTWLPAVRRAWFPGLAGTGHPGHIALTFDDGPDPRSTPHFLDVLDTLAVRATFFVLGESAGRHSGLTREIADRGHELAVHGWTHDRPWLPRPGQDARDIARTVGVLREIGGRAPDWYRPPYGILTGGRWLAARRAGLRTVLWSVWAKDWRADATPASVRGAVRAGLRGGGTVLLHDSDRVASPDCWRATLGALPQLVSDCRDAGFTVGPLADHGVPRTVRPAGAPGPVR
ncbi:polysaccharide deacetylase family protein [Streptomyces sp. NPDC008313]|uniref:polysaccharide deacetylase family protein n=1 Tax=Streptomyces sp. NPDC008313 TaxID=3364826 RepID=UPI0036EBB386